MRKYPSIKKDIDEPEYNFKNDSSFKYVMLDFSNIYLGARYSLQELLDEDTVPFKLKAVISHYLMKDTEPDTTLESQLYYLDAQNFLYQTLRQLRAKVKVNILQERNLRQEGPDGQKKTIRQYKEKVFTLEQLTDMNLAQKKMHGVIVRELIVSRIGLMGFSV